jgi:hypothetical protein
MRMYASEALGPDRRVALVAVVVAAAVLQNPSIHPASSRQSMRRFMWMLWSAVFSMRFGHALHECRVCMLAH